MQNQHKIASLTTWQFDIISIFQKIKCNLYVEAGAVSGRKALRALTFFRAHMMSNEYVFWSYVILNEFLLNWLMQEPPMDWHIVPDGGNFNVSLNARTRILSFGQLVSGALVRCGHWKRATG